MVGQTIDFIGPAGKSERNSIEKKMNIIKATNSKYSCDLDKDVLSIPNQIPLPDSAKVLDDLRNVKEKNELQAGYLEDVLHQKNIQALRLIGQKAFVMKGFNSLNCIQFTRDQGKKLRGKQDFAELNEHEKAIMDILEIKEISENDLQQYVKLHKEYLKSNMIPEENTELNNLFKKEFSLIFFLIFKSYIFIFLSF